MSPLAENLKAAAVYEAAKVAAREWATADDQIVDTIATAVTATVLEELVSREEQAREGASHGPDMSSRDECTLRIVEYAEAARNLRGQS